MDKNLLVDLLNSLHLREWSDGVGVHAVGPSIRWGVATWSIAPLIIRVVSGVGTVIPRAAGDLRGVTVLACALALPVRWMGGGEGGRKQVPSEVHFLSILMSFSYLKTLLKKPFFRGCFFPNGLFVKLITAGTVILPSIPNGTVRECVYACCRGTLGINRWL